MMKYIYLHIDNDGRPFYVGKGNKYRTYDKHNRTKDWHDKSKDGFDVVILESVDNDSDACRLEQYWITRIGRISDGGTLINKTLGGYGKKGTGRTNEPKISFRNGVWYVRQSINGKRVWLGTYQTKDDAIKKILENDNTL